VPYLSATAVVIHYEVALYQVYAPLPFSKKTSTYTTFSFNVQYSRTIWGACNQQSAARPTVIRWPV